MKCSRLSVVAGIVSLSLALCLSVGCRLMSGRNDSDIRVATYNIRFRNGAPSGSDDCWAERQGSVAETIRGMEPDVFGLQEVCPDQLADLRENLGEFSFVGDHRESDRQSGEASPVAYRTDRFDLERSDTFWLSETPDIPGSRGWGAACPRICTYLVLRDRRTDRRFCFANTHMDHFSAEAREKGVLLILERLKGIERNLPIVFVGDHNCRETEASALAVAKELHNALFASDASPKGGWRTWNGWRWRDTEVSTAEALELSAEARNEPRPHPDVDGASRGQAALLDDSFYEKCGGPRIDYIYVSPGMQVLDYETVNATRPGEKRYPSDHFPIVATIRLPYDVWAVPDSPAPGRFGSSGRGGSAPGSGLPKAGMFW